MFQDGQENTFRFNFKQILENYLLAKREAFSSQNIIGSSFKSLEHLTNQLIFNENFEDFEVRASYGKGNWASVPWLAVLDQLKNASMRNGVYVVYLFRDDMSGFYLTLNQGVTEPLSQGKNIGRKILEERADKVRSYIDVHQKQVLNQHGFYLKNSIFLALRGLGANYQPGTIINKWYSSEDLPTDQVLKADLRVLLDVYKQLPIDAEKEVKSRKNVAEFLPIYQAESKNPNGSLPIIQPLKKLSVTSFVESLKEANLKFDTFFVTRFIASMIAKNFTILTGLSGSGKTNLAVTFANWITDSPKQVCLVPVGADWTNREPLLGFSNALVPGTYVKPDSGVIDLLLCALGDPTKPYFLILDEMNLSHVERYFADFLSAIESGDKIYLHPDDQTWADCDVPASINFPKNLFVIGTVNVDETTYMFSPKVLDRAFVHEFRVSSTDMKNFLKSPNKPVLSKIAHAGSSMGQDFIAKAHTSNGDFSETTEVVTKISQFFDELIVLGSEFGYRTASDIFRYGFVLSTLDQSGNLDANNIIDASVISKLLPKIHGSRRKLEQTLIALFKLCLVNTEGEDINDYIDKKKVIDGNENIALPLSLEKITRMYKQIIQDGYTSFSEA